jgi:hypothetical protein
MSKLVVVTDRAEMSRLMAEYPRDYKATGCGSVARYPREGSVKCRRFAGHERHSLIHVTSHRRNGRELRDYPPDEPFVTDPLDGVEGMVVRRVGYWFDD